jgi:hypothetical protein
MADFRILGLKYSGLTKTENFSIRWMNVTDQEKTLEAGGRCSGANSELLAGWRGISCPTPCWNAAYKTYVLWSYFVVKSEVPKRKAPTQWSSNDIPPPQLLVTRRPNHHYRMNRNFSLGAWPSNYRQTQRPMTMDLLEKKKTEGLGM